MSRHTQDLQRFRSRVAWPVKLHRVRRAHPSRAASRSRHPLILVADDDEAVRIGLGEALRAAGYRVRDAGNGADLVALAAEEAPAAIVLDLAMPGSDGFEAVKALRRMDETRHVPIICATASWLGSRPDLLADVGFDAVLRKPFPSAALIGTLRSMMAADVAEATELIAAG